MKVLGLTGGIGAGKSSVAQMFQEKGIAVFNSDYEAKKLYTSSQKVHDQVIELLGSEAYSDGKFNKKWVAQQVFQNKDLLAKLNSIIHPEVKLSFENWKRNQSSEFVVKEAAILFESGAYKQCNAVLTVTADKEIRIERVMKRDRISREQVEERMNKQWQEERKIELSDFVMYNNGSFEELENEFEEIFPSIVFRLA